MPLYDVVGLGVSTLDLLYVVDELPATELVQAAYHSSLQGGGPVATAMVALARLGGRAAMLDRLGDDWKSRLLIEEYRREGVNTQHIRVEPGLSAPIATILVRKADGARTIVYSPGSCPELGENDLAVEAICAAKTLHLNGRHWQACAAAVRLARQNGVKVSFDGGAHRFRPELRRLVPQVDICIVARQFAGEYAATQDIEAAARQILEAGPELVVITAGADGSWVYPAEGGAFHQPAFQVRAVDTTGAGDAYHGAFLFGLVKGLGLEQTARLASAVAALNTLRFGGRAGLPTYAQALEFIQNSTSSQEIYQP